MLWRCGPGSIIPVPIQCVTTGVVHTSPDVTSLRPRTPSPDHYLLAFTLTNVKSPAIWIRTERSKLGLSTRDLAHLAGVSYPTISRIENGHEQPRWSTLEKVFEVLGHPFAAPTDESDHLRLADLSDAWTTDSTGAHHPEWVRLRALVDRIRLRPALVARAIQPEPPPSRSQMMDALLAAVADKLADDHGIARPRWTRRRPPLSQPWSAPTRPSKRAEAKSSAPAQFLKRGLLIPESAIWRERELTRG